MTEMQSLAKSGKVWQSLDFAFQLVTEKQSLTKRDQIFDKMQALNFDPQQIFDLFEHDKCGFQF